MDAIENVSRRHFLGGLVSTGALVLVARVLPESVWAQTVDGATRASTSSPGRPMFVGPNSHVPDMLVDCSPNT